MPSCVAGFTIPAMGSLYEMPGLARHPENAIAPLGYRNGEECAYDSLVKDAFRYAGPPVLVLVVVLGLSVLLPGRYKFLPVWVSGTIFAFALLLTASVFLAAYRGQPHRAMVATGLQVALLGGVVVTLLVHLLQLLITGGKDVRGLPLLTSGVYVWVSNVLAFGLLFWLLDRGGPHARMDEHGNRAELLFPEMTAGDVADPHWSPNFVEYLYLSFTNSTAFSPTDTLPLSSRMRFLMAAESSMSLVTVALVAARAVNILA